jgi:UPF0148 protein
MMSRPEKNRVKLAAELVSKGATMLGEPCPKCGGIQVRYHGKVYCTFHEDLSAVTTSQVVSYDSVVAQMREVLLSRLNEAAAALGTEKDVTKQEQLVSLIERCFGLLQKLPEK